MELYFRDLTAEAQESYLELHGITDPAEGNFDILPICVFDQPEEL